MIETVTFQKEQAEQVQVGQLERAEQERVQIVNEANAYATSVKTEAEAKAEQVEAAMENEKTGLAELMEADNLNLSKEELVTFTFVQRLDLTLLKSAKINIGTPDVIQCFYDDTKCA